MCGIAGIYLKNPEDDYLRPKDVDNLVDWLYCGIEHRGTHATGIAVQDKDGKSFLEKSDMPASKFIFWRRDVMPNPRVILLHTRLHTKGKPENLLNNHPIQYHNIMVVHNGHISNDDELFEKEELERFAEVDSEIIPALLHKYGMLEPREALEKMSGGFAIAAFDNENPGKLLLAKGPSSPLVFFENSAMLVWASEQKAIQDALEFGLGYEVKYSEIKTVKYAEYLLIDGENSFRKDFHPNYKTVTTPYPNYVRGGAYSSSGFAGDDQCDDCFKYFPRWKLNKVEQNYYCDPCERKLFYIAEDGTRIPKPKGRKLSKGERKRIRREAKKRMQESLQKKEQKKLTAASQVKSVTDMNISDVLDDEHWFVCELVAEFFGTNKEFVDMVLFSEELFSSEDPMIATIHLEFSEKYQEYLKDIQDDTDIILDRIHENEVKGKKFPVGFGGGEVEL